MKVLILFAAIFTILGSSQALAAGEKLCIYNYHTSEVKEGAPKDMNEMNIDIKLLKLLAKIQSHFKADCIELISGFRSSELNRKLKKSGANVAEESQHLLGKAADIHIDEATEEAVAEYARSLKAGGVGYYPAEDFVHIDVGDVRKWDLPDKPGRLLMAFRKSDVWQILTDKDLNFLNEPVTFTVLNITRTEKNFNGKIELQLFRRGEWKAVRNISAGSLIKWLDSDEFGKYRLVIPGKYLEARSNEFYRKRK